MPDSEQNLFNHLNAGGTENRNSLVKWIGTVSRDVGNNLFRGIQVINQITLFPGEFQLLYTIIIITIITISVTGGCSALADNA